MSVSKTIRESVPLSIEPTSAQPPSRDNRLTLIAAKPDIGEFWSDFNRTLDDFFSTIHASKLHIRRLNDRLVERDSRIEILMAENAALREQLEAKQTSAGPLAPRVEPLAPIDETPPELRLRRGIWSRLSGLERESDRDSLAPRRKRRF